MSLKRSFRSITCICVSMAQTIILPLPFFGEQFACWFVPNCHHFLTDYPTISGQKTTKNCTSSRRGLCFTSLIQNPAPEDSENYCQLQQLHHPVSANMAGRWEHPRTIPGHFNGNMLELNGGFSGNSCLIAEGTWDWDYEIIQQLVLLLRSFGCVSCLIAALQFRTLLPQFPESPHRYVWTTG